MSKRRNKKPEVVKEATPRRSPSAGPRRKYLDSLVGREPALWAEVEALAASRLPSNYDRAMELVVDLRALAILRGQAIDFSRRLALLRDLHARKPAVMDRLAEAGF